MNAPGDTDAPGPAPLPPADLAARELPLHVAPAETRFSRIHPADLGVLFFGPAEGTRARGRWDAPAGGFGVCYLGEEPHVAFAETFLREPGLAVVEEADLAARSLAQVRATRALRLAAMHGPGLARIGATAAVCSGAYAVSRAWALALHAHPAGVDGIRYRARHDDDGFAIALFDRAAGAVEVIGTDRLDPSTGGAWIAPLLDRYGIGMV